ncbi:MAG: radical SAM family heme chaperone HemW [Candidatus Krumholzibacteria bacterium]|nr:radical SAM family heme chaperone HemW [Candidatus Krumholzibacteria bacterium]
MRAISLYVHVPFCKRRCSYCTFYHTPFIDTYETAFVEALVREFEETAAKLDQPFCCPTVYFGGGTPSVLSRDSLDKIFGAISSYVAPDGVEITFETNPDDVTEELVSGLRAHGVNRLSVGIQSMDAGALKILKRCTVTVNERAIDMVRGYFDNFSVDVLLGVPDGSRAGLGRTLARVLDWDVPHVSVYCLEPGGVMGSEVKEFLDRVDGERSAEEYLYVCERLRARGYQHYEISNFAKPGCESRHNRVYWQGEDYLGLGPAAHSYIDGERSHNEASIERYVSAAPGGAASTRHPEVRGPEQRRLEALMLALRTDRGLPVDHLESARSEIEALVAGSLARIVDDRLLLTDRGFLVMNDIVLRLCEAS